MFHGDPRRTRRQLHNMKIVDHLCLQGGGQAAPDKFAYRLAEGYLTALRVCFYFPQNIIIQR